MSDREPEGISLGSDAGWRIERARDPESFFAALRAIVPPGSVLALHDPQGEEVREFLTHQRGGLKHESRCGYDMATAKDLPSGRHGRKPGHS